MPELVLHANGRTWTLDASRSYTVGRDQQADIPTIDRRVSRRHITIRCVGGTWVIEDLGSANGTFADGRRVQRIEIGHGSIVRLGNFSSGMRLDFTEAAPTPSPAPAPSPVSGDQAPAAAQGRAAAHQGDARPEPRPEARPEPRPQAHPEPRPEAHPQPPRGPRGDTGWGTV
ncbi:FHA domain-containing protein, partial [Streptomyces yatensis]